MKAITRRSFDTSYLAGPRRIGIEGGEGWLKPELLSTSKEWNATKEDSIPVVDPDLSIPALWPVLPRELGELDQRLIRSRSLLFLEEDWDGEGGTPYAHAHWLRVVGFLATHASWLWRKYGSKLIVPAVVPGPAGSIDVHWETAEVELLVKIPADESEPASYYGDNFGKDRVQGTFDLSHNNYWLMLWLMGRK